MSMRTTVLKNRHRLFRRRKRRPFFIASGLILAVPFLALWGFWVTRTDWVSLDVSRITNPQQTLLVTDQNGEVVSRLYASENRRCIRLETLPLHVKQAFLAAEDARFYSHFGVDVIRIGGALLADLKAGSYVQGASTITQQLIKLTHLTSDKTLERKLNEAFLAVRLECALSKDAILEAYLNTVYFGGGYYGIEAAAQGYFGIPASRLSLSQSALLAGVLKSPSAYAPDKQPAKAIGRRDVILNLMHEYDMIDRAALDSARSEPLRLLQDDTENARGSYVDLSLTEACRLLDITMEELLTEGYTIHTAMDPVVQGYLVDAFSVDAYFPTFHGTSAEGAAVLIDAKTGGISALLGGRDQSTALAFNRVTDIRRQPGSAIKPILVYAPALEAGYTTATMLLDDAITFSDYTPNNAGGRFSGWVTMREAVTRSLNLPAVSLFEALGVDACKAFAAELGIPFDPRDTRLALALGGFTYGVSPLQLCGAYAAFANGGVYQKPFLIRSITRADGSVCYTHTPVSQRVMSETNCFLLTDMLRSVVQDGTAQRLSRIGIDLAAKTGTVGDARSNRDIWLCCFNPELAAVVWMGFDDASDGHALPADSGGGTFPAELLSEVLYRMYADRPAPTFSVPPGIVRVALDTHTLSQDHVPVLASALTPTGSRRMEYFRKGTEPIVFGSYWQSPIAPHDLSAVPERDGVRICFTAPSHEMQYRLYRQDENGFSVLLETFSFVRFPVSYLDTDARGLCRYFIVPVHPSLETDGSPLTGIPSAVITVQTQDS